MTLQVMPGDTVRMKVQAKYFKKAKSKDPIAGMASIVAASMGAGTISEAPQIAQGIQETLGLGQAGLVSKDNTIPKAYINYLFFDTENNFKKGGYKQVSEAALGSFEELDLEYVPEEEGTMMIYTANQTAEDLDVYMDDLTILHTEGPIIRVDDYYPFGMTYHTSERTGYATNNFLYQGKEIQSDLGLDTYDYGARMYDPQIARFTSVDPLADIAEAWTPYHFVRGNPINRIDPTGLTDFKINKETGDVAQVGEANDDPDRILKTDKDGNVKKKGEGFLGFLVSEKNRGEAKVAVGGIEQGFLSDGMNLKSEDNVFDVGGEGQPTLGGFEDFALKISNYVDKEVDGVYLSNKNETDISHVYLAGYKNNDSQNARGGFNLHKYRPDLVGNTEVRELFHTHLSRFGDSDRLRPSSIGPLGGDVGYKKRQSEYHPTLKFRIITNPKSFTY
jgi:RHS repeat-associated protein